MFETVSTSDSERGASDCIRWTVYRTNWIRSLSRRDRWAEELVMVQSEMDWFVRFAKHRMGKARGWANAALTDGHRSYALRQAKMWCSVGVLAKAEFLKRANVVVDVDVEERVDE